LRKRCSIRYIDLHINFKGNVAPHLAVWTPEMNQAYILAGLPAGYEQTSFYESKDYGNLQRNLMGYGERIQRQINHSNGCLSATLAPPGK